MERMGKGRAAFTKSRSYAVFVVSAAIAFCTSLICLWLTTHSYGRTVMTFLPPSSLRREALGAFQAELRHRRNLTQLEEALDTFDIRTYRLFNPDVMHVLEQTSVHSEGDDTQARLHFLHTGRQEGRVGKRMPLFINYTAPFGLANQIYSHLNALVIAYSMHASLIVADAWSRNSFESVHIIGTRWAKEPVESLLDIAAMQQYWSNLGIELTQAPETKDCLQIDVTTGNGDPFRITDGPQHISVYEAVSFITANVSQQLQAELSKDPAQDMCVVIFIGRPIVLLNHRRSYPMGAAVANGMFFAPAVVDAAMKILANINDAQFLGAHLRLEDDWRALLKEDPLDTYLALMKAAGYNENSTVYVASGLLGYANHTEYGNLTETLVQKGVAGRVVHKESVLSPATLQGFHSEQRGLVDLLVMTQANKVISDHRSSFGVFIREFRAIHGRPRSTFFAVGGQGGISNAWAFGE